MVKMSENSVHLARLLVELSARYLPLEKLAFFECGGRGPAFSTLPFDHLIFTGSGATGRAVMVSAAANLCPVTLELTQLAQVGGGFRDFVQGGVSRIKYLEGARG